MAKLVTKKTHEPVVKKTAQSIRNSSRKTSSMNKRNTRKLYRGQGR